jgi:hypothetical protein
MTALEELKASSRNTLGSKRRALWALAEKYSRPSDPRSELQFHDALLDIIAELPTVYKATVAQVREAQTLEEVTALWKEAYEAYESLHNSWRELSRLPGNFQKDELFFHCTKRIEHLERLTQEAYSFHAE